MARMALPRVDGTPKSGKTKGGGSNGNNDNDRFMFGLASGDSERPSTVSLVAKVDLSSNSLCSLVHSYSNVVLFFFVRFRVQTVATALYATGGVQTTPHRSHTRALFLVARFTCDHTSGSRA